MRKLRSTQFFIYFLSEDFYLLDEDKGFEYV